MVPASASFPLHAALVKTVQAEHHLVAGLAMPGTYCVGIASAVPQTHYTDACCAQRHGNVCPHTCALTSGHPWRFRLPFAGEGWQALSRDAPCGHRSTAAAASPPSQKYSRATSASCLSPTHPYSSPHQYFKVSIFRLCYHHHRTRILPRPVSLSAAVRGLLPADVPRDGGWPGR